MFGNFWQLTPFVEYMHVRRYVSKERIDKLEFLKLQQQHSSWF